MNINDIAKKAGVSKSTVSRVLNNDKNVSDKSREKVKETIKKYNFIPNRAAATTKIKRKVVLVLVTRLDSYSETRIIRGMMEQADEDVEFLITETLFSMEKTKLIIENNKNVNGIIVFAISGEKYQFLEEMICPVVIIGQKLETNCSNLYFPDYEAVNQMVKKQKIKNAIFIGYDQNDKTMLKRYQACVDNLGQIDYYKISKYGHVAGLEKIDLSQYDTFICGTETIALYTYKCILQANIKKYQILSIGNNRNINYIIDNFVTIDFNFKENGKFIMKNLFTEKSFTRNSVYQIVNNNRI